MAGIFSMGAFVTYGNMALNNQKGKTSNLQEAFRADLKKNIARAGYPSKDEIGIIDEINDFTFDNTLKQIPQLVSGYMRDENRKFNLPAPDGSCTDATIEIVHKETQTKSGVAKLGNGKAPIPWESTIKEHDEYAITNHRDAFKVK